MSGIGMGPKEKTKDHHHHHHSQEEELLFPHWGEHAGMVLKQTHGMELSAQPSLQEGQPHPHDGSIISYVEMNTHNTKIRDVSEG